jgi:hypothetical protein
MAAGWEIGQDEGYEDEPGVFVVMSGDDHGKSYISWPAAELRSGVDEGWKQKVAGAALAGAAALGAGGAQAQATDKYDPSWNAHSMTHHIGSDVSSTRSMNSADPSKNIDDFQRRIQKVSGPNANGEYKVVVIQGNDIVSHYVTKTPPPGWLYKEDRAEGVANADEDPNLAKAYRMGNEAYRAYKTDPARAQAAQDRIEAEFPQYLKMWTTGYHDGERFDKSDVAESRDPIEQLRADILRFSR